MTIFIERRKLHIVMDQLSLAASHVEQVDVIRATGEGDVRDICADCESSAARVQAV
jgi:hypothetical protein